MARSKTYRIPNNGTRDPGIDDRRRAAEAEAAAARRALRDEIRRIGTVRAPEQDMTPDERREAMRAKSRMLRDAAPPTPEGLAGPERGQAHVQVRQAVAAKPTPDDIRRSIGAKSAQLMANEQSRAPGQYTGTAPLPQDADPAEPGDGAHGEAAP